ncbi:dihydrodipicolinate synthase family protein [Microbacterium excoecariae]|uniref:dihydrodipicolinate synthase family protein n=1 Tax=Microbacterium excoecariae TaxID=2715210 RepID=UPI0014075252|nr:dihydrodipicolinate synthase family protein [Microbacterium excoecariae]NHI17714.1 dihydrodipicolinate synthase family protein [Microbacterium excoecariae]
MNRHDVEWSGYWPAASTPFAADGSVDEPGLRQLMDLYVSQGVHGVLINGSTGEWFSQSVAERRQVAEVAVDAVAGRIPVVIGVTASTADEAIALARHAESAGADGALATVPPYVHPSPAEALEFYREVSGATALPFMVYNWPRGVSADLAQVPGLMSDLADLPNVAAIKDSTGDWNAMVGTVQEVAERVRVFGSLSHRKGLAIMAGLGGDGAIDGGGVAAPYGVPFYEAALAGNLDLARFWVDKYQAISGRLIAGDYSGRFASPISQLKLAMELLGQPAGRVRRPLLEVTDAGAIRDIAAILRAGELPLSADREAAVIAERATW